MFNITDVDFINYRDKYYLFVDLSSWGKLRFGDLVQISIVLYLLKLSLIDKYSFLSLDNFYYLFNIDYKINQLYSSILLFDNLYKTNAISYTKAFSLSPAFFGTPKVGIPKSRLPKYDVTNIIGSHNIWLYKQYLEVYNYKVIDDSYKLINFKSEINPLIKNECFIFPIVNKGYNVERNWSVEQLLQLLDYIGNSYKIIIPIINDVNISLENRKLLSTFNPNIQYKTYNNWNEVFNDIITRCNYFISGDCGLSHFVCNLSRPERPQQIDIYFNTNPLPFIIKPKQQLAFTNSIDIISELTFHPYTMWKDLNYSLKHF